ncbi:MAG: UUP1 family membrane protein [Chlorogloeopsis fritschii C42_A2020_084]|uniref:UUP1 family membrane protein n=1 Tax=Chlorogloeopsis fritschii TaxID=1124 RepID=UPI001A10438D|nr:UUP1 family membrane protein [Chlorogloeopsis fritschii]MBF2005309.1 UUP1 family membrane protein [Chlorogloeopsis fritschii C42_A2020_084]
MNRTFHALLLALFLTAIGLTIFFHKLTTSDVPLLPNQAYRSWYVEAKLSLDSESPLLASETGLPTQLEFHLPQASERYEIVSEDFLNRGFARQIKTFPNSANRVAVFTKEDDDGSEFLFYRAVIRRRPGVKPGTEEIPISGRRLVDQQLVRFGENTARVQDNLKENLPTAEINALLNEAKKQSSDRLSLAKQIYQIALRTDDIRVQAIQRNLRKEESTPELAAFLLNRANVPARVGNGIFLRSDEVYSTDFIQWLEIKEGDRWLAFDPIDFSFREQDRYLTWWYGSDRVLQAEGASNIDLEVVVQPNIDRGLTSAILEGKRASNPLLEYSLLRLPLASQRVFQVLVLVPIGALVISILHQMVGLPTFGTFTPILIGLSFRETGLFAGVPLFILVVIIGLLIRAYLNRLQLLIVPRLAAILTATVLIMGALAILLQSLEFNLGLSLSLFPIVILAMTIERAALMWEEAGAKETIIAGLGSVFAAVVGYYCIINPYVQHLAFAFPELLLLVLALNVLVGRYNGYKLIEYFRFLALQRQLKQKEG